MKVLFQSKLNKTIAVIGTIRSNYTWEYLWSSLIPVVKEIPFGKSKEELVSMLMISSVTLWSITSTPCNWEAKGSSNMRGTKISPFSVGQKGNAPLCQKQQARN